MKDMLLYVYGLAAMALGYFALILSMTVPFFLAIKLLAMLWSALF